MRVVTKDLVAGMELGGNVSNVNGVELLGIGTVLTERHSAILQIWGIESVGSKGGNTQGDAPDPSLASFAPEILKRAGGNVHWRFRLMWQTGGPVPTVKRLIVQRVAP